MSFEIDQSMQFVVQPQSLKSDIRAFSPEFYHNHADSPTYSVTSNATNSSFGSLKKTPSLDGSISFGIDNPEVYYTYNELITVKPNPRHSPHFDLAPNPSSPIRRVGQSAAIKCELMSPLPDPCYYDPYPDQYYSAGPGAISASASAAAAAAAVNANVAASASASASVSASSSANASIYVSASAAASTAVSSFSSSSSCSSSSGPAVANASLHQTVSFPTPPGSDTTPPIINDRWCIKTEHPVNTNTSTNTSLCTATPCGYPCGYNYQSNYRSWYHEQQQQQQIQIQMQSCVQTCCSQSLSSPPGCLSDPSSLDHQNIQYRNCAPNRIPFTSDIIINNNIIAVAITILISIATTILQILATIINPQIHATQSMLLTLRVEVHIQDQRCRTGRFSTSSLLTSTTITSSQKLNIAKT
ncbi:hypothetical protein F4703DRAFT_1038568 [Phycomyces blakesleeanus]